jgi:hypothetical protein
MLSDILKDQTAVTLVIVLFFIIKHFLADFVLQTPYQYLNKHIFMHPGGLIHAGIHIICTWIFVYGLTIDNESIYLLLLAEFIFHYLVDFGKENIKILYDLKITDKWYWILLGIDQLFHYISYIVLTGFYIICVL